ncbi:hypothetical protein KM1_136530 [Entamoeba histolytica HM-3:IMSS]|uniref:Transmembrane protein n=6 Tax=Entamoeba histolytica TaxID=5759 RepID=C4LY40_ENTH1|nr:hypothetical protein EHI_177360 [Entamoeba histolytica HM-1:IMSS]EMD47972.1 Hypothetical protein EHI5A_109420 [Entamoeba histolytica KU27]EMS12346.1 hypothetical protein KM1_136530 [Entamoeba histolytica HM-3:IMSS]ENY61722.1 hypothetical protein EHI7A_076200 [Entamoeba histolytica HM-1:IMSS-A]GAT93693.1 hypothetical protein CL6EHI_177360 [Entamoeba histolytica]EAL47426.1 hypothetical protein EHI_177360 [Entamoeba histolytica HM-1:IMSS]|eukprot:XP_652812.1 hypothetical protein EHI_177360 [Entamoeba histolytica HM-1:IMSS]
MQYQQHTSVIYLLVTFLGVSFGLITLLYTYQRTLTQTSFLSSKTLLDNTTINAFAYYKGGYQIIQQNIIPNLNGTCTASDYQLEQIFELLFHHRGNVFFRQFIPFYSNTSESILLADTIIELNGKYDIKLYTSCSIQTGIFINPSLSINQNNGTVTMLKCYLAVTNWIQNDLNSLRNIVKPQLLEASRLKLDHLPSITTLQTMNLVFNSEKRPVFRGVISGDGENVITIKGVSFEEETQKFQIMILLNIFVMVYYIQSWVVLSSESNDTPPTSFISLSLFPV